MPKSVDKKQSHPRFTDAELELIKTVFAENEELIRVCYKVFFQIPLTEEEEIAKINTFKGEDLHRIFDKLFLPGAMNEQIFFGVDDWIDVNISDKPIDQAMIAVKARELSIIYIRQSIRVLFEGTTPTMGFRNLTDTANKTDNDILRDITARKEIIAKVRNLFGTLQNWAGTKSETPEEQIKRLFTNSNK